MSLIFFEMALSSIGLRFLLAGLTDKTRIEVYVGSSPAKSIPSRTGNGKIRHLDTALLWIQQTECRNDVVFKKVSGAVKRDTVLVVISAFSSTGGVLLQSLHEHLHGEAV